ncbi:hypothetical protein [Taklimakanibacter deserti]|uniref:hypothetical protein n=1 Tax=Taklimakanibacter deserti TaxID=2267839 RepID=UPI0013C52C79
MQHSPAFWVKLTDITERNSGMKKILPVISIAAAAAVFASPALACEQHQSHAAMKTVEAAPAPQPSVVIEPAAQPNPTSEIKTEGAMSRPLGTAYEGCNRSRKGQTVYLTQ